MDPKQTVRTTFDSIAGTDDDVGCGKGAVLVRAAAAVGGNGLAVGVDISPRMVEAAKAAAERLPVEVRVESDAGVEALLSDAGFGDVHTSSTVIQVRFADKDHDEAGRIGFDQVVRFTYGRRPGTSPE